MLFPARIIFRAKRKNPDFFSVQKNFAGPVDPDFS